jgi:hypothetical protein
LVRNDTYKPFLVSKKEEMAKETFFNNQFNWSPPPQQNRNTIAMWDSLKKINWTLISHDPINILFGQLFFF